MTSPGDYSGGTGLMIIFGGAAFVILAAITVLIFAIVNHSWWLAIGAVVGCAVLWFAFKLWINWQIAISSH